MKNTTQKENVIEVTQDAFNEFIYTPENAERIEIESMTVGDVGLVSIKVDDQVIGRILYTKEKGTQRFITR